ncbi:MAG: HlyD family type I secretion periplasmic adaptor subunit [Alphaproteobacteria bacterium]|nr:HlyD family type I secretion periplasmic adaptor subunit [Alphaproteobacteria bacterium]
MSQFKFKDDGLDTDFMPDILAADLKKESQIAPLLLLTISLTFIILIIWAAFSEIDEITRGEGTIIPSTKLQVVNHLEGGIIQSIHINEGDIVEKKQLLLNIDNTIAQARFSEGQTLYYRFIASVARLRAQISGQPFIVPQEVQEKAPLEAEDAVRLYNAHLEDLKSDQLIADQEIEQKQQELNELTSRTEELTMQRSLISEKVEKIAPLVKQKLEPEITLTDLKIRESELRSEIASLKSNIARAKAAVLQAEQRARQVPIKFKAENWNELKDVNNKLASAKGSFTSEGDRFSRTEVRSPVRGIVKQLLVTTVGGVVKPGEDLVEIVPLEDTLLIEAKINPKDIAFLRPGLQASVKITAYDYAVYGDLKGELIRVSADSITDDQGNVFYKAYLKTEGTILSKTKKVLPIMPGMISSVDILTGKKSVLNYLLKPILKAKQRALTER